MKSTTLLVITLVAIFAVGAFLYNSSGNSDASVRTNGNTGQVQKVTLSMKNYNYYPNTVTVNSGSTVRISLDSSVRGCYRSFTIRELGLAKYLKTPEDYMEFTPTKPGTYTFACSMGMGYGKLVVK